MAEDRRRRAEDRRRRAEDRGRKTEDGGQKTKDRKQRTARRFAEEMAPGGEVSINRASAEVIAGDNRY